MIRKKQQLFLNLMLIFFILQPFFDILSRMAILGYIPNISTYIKPLFVFGLTGYLLIFYSKRKKIWIPYAILFIILIIGHTYILNSLLIDKSVILHELRFLINIAYMLSIYISLDTIYFYYNDKEEMYRKIKKTILYTFILYFAFYLISIISGTSGLTYEIADKTKLGYKGWYDSGQILGHAYSIMLPLLIYTVLDPKRVWYKRVLIILLFIVSISLIGTKVPYYITLLVLGLYLFITIFIKLFNKEHKPNYFNIIFISTILMGMIITYKYTPVKYNTDLNNKVSGISVSEYDLDKESGYIENNKEELEKKYIGKDITELYNYNINSNKASDYLKKMFISGKLHPSNMRKKQVIYATNKYKLSNIKYKVFGMGFLNQSESFSLESDLLMALFSFGILGFILFLLIPIKEFLKSTIYILKNLNKTDFETYMLYMGLGIFFCISTFAGYTYIYTNFSIFLISLALMLRLKLDINMSLNIDNKEKKSITFLMLHLGYGGIETATINTANALSKKYDVNLISFYNLKNNITNKINKNIKVKYLYNGEPNKDELLESLKNKNILKIIKEGFKSVKILLLKKILIIKEIINNNSNYLVSTRLEYSVLLSKYGKIGQIKIAQEHRHHNNEKKYIKKIKNNLNNIDYLFSLTNSLKHDYISFFKNKNDKTIVVTVPNMIELSSDISSLKEKNLISVGRLHKGKRIDELISIFSKIDYKKHKLFIIGDGDEYDNLKKLISDLKLTEYVYLLGYKNHSEIKDYMLKSCVFLMTSETEGLPMVLLEAMSYGIPCIAYETDSGVNDIIENGVNGYVIKNRNEKEYIDKLNLILNNKNIKNMSKEALNSAMKYKKENIVKIWESIINK